MKPTIQEVRRANLRRIIEQRGGISSVAKTLGLVGPSHLSQILSAHRPFTEKSARKFEAKLGLVERAFARRSGHGYDGDHRESLVGVHRGVADGDAWTLALLLLAGEELERLKVKLSPERFARLVALVYEASVNAGAVDRTNVVKLIELMQ